MGGGKASAYTPPRSTHNHNLNNSPPEPTTQIMTAVVKISNYPLNKWELNDTILMTVNDDVYQMTLDVI